ncbi:MAG: DUF1127 domain-containing protein [Pseudomonadota bacterium]
MAISTTAPTFAAPFFGSVNPVAKLVSAVVHWNEARLTRKELLKLTDRQLDDIGLARRDIDAI